MCTKDVGGIASVSMSSRKEKKTTVGTFWALIALTYLCTHYFIVSSRTTNYTHHWCIHPVNDYIH